MFGSQPPNLSCRLGNAPTPIMNGVSKPLARKIINCNIDESKILPKDGCFVYCSFTVEETGFYNIFQQIALICVSESPVTLEYIQYGLSLENMVDCEKLGFNSIVLNTSVQPQNIISQNQNTILNLERDVIYQAWLNIASPSGDGLKNNSSFEYSKIMSCLKLYRL